MPVLKIKTDTGWEKISAGPLNGGDADMLDGKHASEFASASDIEELKNKVGDIPVSEQISNAIDNIGNIDGIDDALTIDTGNVTIGTPNSINADTLGGRSADEFVLVSDLEDLLTEPYDDTELRGLISENSTEIKNLKNMIGDASVSTQVDTAMNDLRQEILGGEW